MMASPSAKPASKRATPLAKERLTVNRLIAYLVPAVAIAAAVIVAAVILTSGGKPSPHALQLSGTSGPFSIRLLVEPDKAGPNSVRVDIQGKSSTEGVSSAYLLGTMVAMAMSTGTVALQPKGSGVYMGTVILPMGGPWDFGLVIRPNRGGHLLDSTFRGIVAG